jgi:glycogen debranching enzyme
MPGSQHLRMSPRPDGWGPTRSTAEDLGRKRYAAAGDGAYVIGLLDGSFPPIGTRIRGEMGGVWAHPIKLLAGYWFALNGSWLPSAIEFTSGAGYVQLRFPDQAGLACTRTEFSPDGLPVVIVGLTLRNNAAENRRVALTLGLRSQLICAYPWTESKPTATEHNDHDRAIYDPANGRITIRRADQPWQALIGSSIAPTGGSTGDHFWGPVPEEQRRQYTQSAYGTGGELHWELALGAGTEKTLWVGVAGAYTSEQNVEDALRRALVDPSELLRAKIRERNGLLAETQLTVPDQQLSDALRWATLNMADLRRHVTGAQIRDVNEGKDYPAPVATLPALEGVGDGFPDYPFFYGTGSGYIVYPLVASGLWEPAVAHLRTLRDVSRAINGRTGKVVHEIISDGSVYLGNNAAPGDTNETALFATAVDVLWRWTGNDALRDEMYDFIVDGMRHITSDLDRDGDLWPEGNGIGERPGMGVEQLDVAADTWQALRAVNHMAKSRGDDAIAVWANRRADAMEAAFDAEWWMPGESLYADSRSNTDDVVSEEERRAKGWSNVATAPDQQLQQRVWIGVTPMEIGLAPAERAQVALARLESADFSGPGGLYLVGERGGPDRQAVKKCWTVMSGVMALAEANYGRLGADQALRYMQAIVAQLDLEQPGTLAEVAPSPDYYPFGDLNERMMFNQAWASYGLSWTILARLLGVQPDLPSRQLTVIPHVPPTWPGLAAERLRMGTGSIAVSADRDAQHYRTTVDAPAGWTLTIGHTLPARTLVTGVLLDDAPADYAVNDTIRGREVQVETTTGVPRRLIVTVGGY